MNIYLITSGILCLILGLLHSILGELLIFRTKKKTNKLVPTLVTNGLKERHLRIIWATWHLTSFFGWCIGTLLIKIALDQNLVSKELLKFIIASISISMLCSSILVFIATKGKHPGWIILLGISILTFLGT
ncbi:hypothetical protein [Aquimarina aggregata]|uniref:hypothetical protein n=1 Tax=Aquimarina aggregata TaxID=1642818 RepID=UPI000835EA52|nr:hypothetical protein [Aquimarina aggregata]